MVKKDIFTDHTLYLGLYQSKNGNTGGTNYESRHGSREIITVFEEKTLIDAYELLRCKTAIAIL